MAISERYYKTMFQNQIFLVFYSYECAWAITQVSQIILLVRGIVLDNHMSFTYPWVLVMSVLNYKVVKCLTRLKILTTDNCASVFFLPLWANQALSVNVHDLSNNRFNSFQYLNAHLWCLSCFFIRDQNTFDRFIYVKWLNHWFVVINLTCITSTSRSCDNYMLRSTCISSVVTSPPSVFFLKVLVIYRVFAWAFKRI